MDKVSQNRLILDYADRTGGITPKEAMIHCRCMRLAARIKELEAAGHKFSHDWITEYIDGVMVRYMRYGRQEQ